MKRSFILLVFVLQFVCTIVAQTDWKTEYERLVVENSVLKQDTTNLARQKKELINQLSAAGDSIRDALNLKAENRKLKSELERARVDSAQLSIRQDSIDQLLEEKDSLQNVVTKSKSDLASCYELNRRNEPLVHQHQNVLSNLKINYSGKSVDVLYNTTTKEQLQLCKDLYGMFGESCPASVIQTIECFEAEEQCSHKFDKTLVDMKRAPLLKHNSKTSKDLALRLQQYATVYAEADSLWNAIKTEVCKEEIVEESFSQIQSKRQIWQRTQKFLNKYPNLTHDYPYIYEELQKMLREIWKNANNFNKIPAPFK